MRRPIITIIRYSSEAHARAPAPHALPDGLLFRAILYKRRPPFIVLFSHQTTSYSQIFFSHPLFVPAADIFRRKAKGRERERSTSPPTTMSANHRHQLSTLHPLWAILSSPIPPSTLLSRATNCYSPRVPSSVPLHRLSFKPQSNLLFSLPVLVPLPVLYTRATAQASVALAAAGIHPPPDVPVTPLQQSQFSPAFGGPQFPPFQYRNRRQPSISTGGSPKAQLGGVGKNYRHPSPTAVALQSLCISFLLSHHPLPPM